MVIAIINKNRAAHRRGIILKRDITKIFIKMLAFSEDIREQVIRLSGEESMPSRENNMCKEEVGSYLIDQDIIMMSLLLVQSEREIRHYVSTNKPRLYGHCVLGLYSESEEYLEVLSRAVHDLITFYRFLC